MPTRQKAKSTVLKRAEKRQKTFDSRENAPPALQKRGVNGRYLSKRDRADNPGDSEPSLLGSRLFSPDEPIMEETSGHQLPSLEDRLIDAPGYIASMRQPSHQLGHNLGHTNSMLGHQMFGHPPHYQRHPEERSNSFDALITADSIAASPSLYLRFRHFAGFGEGELASKILNESAKVSRQDEDLMESGKDFSIVLVSRECRYVLILSDF